jgi:hypothetical protein
MKLVMRGVVVALSLLLLTVTLAASDVPQMINYQGHLANADGEPLDTVVSMTFAIYDVPSGGSPVWSELHPTVSVSDGLFDVALGSSGSPLPHTVLAGAARYLGITIGTDSEMKPRVRLTSSGFAHRVSSIDGAETGILTGTVEIGPAEGKDDRAADPALIVRGNDADSVVISPVDDITLYSTNDAGEQTTLLTSSARGGALLVSATDVAKGTLRRIEINPGDSIALRAVEANGDEMVLITADPGGGAMHVSATDVAKNLMRTISISPRDSIVLSAAESNGDQTILITADPNGGAILVTATDAAKGTLRTVEISPRDSVVLRATENNGDEVILITADPTGGAMYVSATDVAKADPDAIVGTIALNRDGIFILGSDVSDTSVSVTATGEIVGTGGLEVGSNNTASGDLSSISGGSNNRALGVGATIGGGSTNSAYGDYSTIVGGYQGNASGDYPFIGGGGLSGQYNDAYSYGVIGGGANNFAGLGLNNPYTTVMGGSSNEARYYGSTVSGGQSNRAVGYYCVVSGGHSNHTSSAAEDSYGYCGGGYSNNAYYQYCAVGGGMYTSASFNATCIGGYGNGAGYICDFVGGGKSVACPSAPAYNQCKVAVGGLGNRSRGECAVIGGGGGWAQADSNSALDFATVPGGMRNHARGKFSFAAGRRAVVSSSHPGTFLWADSNDVDFNSAAAMEFAARATGGVRFVTAIDGSGNPTAGVTLASGGGSWSSISDRNAKENFEDVDFRELLAKLMSMELTTWNYKTQDESIRHIGPTAQDFFDTFAVGEDDRHITTIDGIGVALSAIKGLCLHRQELLEKVAKHEQLKKRVEELEKLVERLVRRGGDGQ